jgi:hypothetical protein
MGAQGPMGCGRTVRAAAVIAFAFLAVAPSARATSIDLGHPTFTPSLSTGIGAVGQDRSVVFDVVTSFSITSAGRNLGLPHVRLETETAPEPSALAVLAASLAVLAWPRALAATLMFSASRRA